MRLVERAPAKLNLALHVTGRRADGYHLLDSLVCFADIGDAVALEPGPLSLTIDGPFAAGLSTDDNLCLRAARLAGGDAAIRLTKNLPVASGIGGGSADAAAVLRGLLRMGHPLPDRALDLGADVPVCLASRPARMQGIGDVVTPLPPLAPLTLVLVNPRVAVPTPAIFAALDRRDNPGLPPLPDVTDRAALLDWLAGTRNDLEAPAIATAPVIADVIAALRAQGADLARMSGSGATCFGIFGDADHAARAAAALGRKGWWAVATELASDPRHR
ncbi:4-(cytidine 5'-diphospho)-2-C-methyl-D-erythritol kinase [Paracoccus aestuarii]|uniref:4-diphosphocytidyl-2-C-methyl-D-erythritol kinase n=1 Tax=Paracoccus aestuarii TaxID=453842 RepID=A0A418ZQZ8_9RHOB|nr:4-(cytidine 5'-diphospho)-2-C-methyl-D-erythritol kinase [Paracoccus aestuarii]RJK98733.1 4-(cytidine 5'-diphospho)-2-C-methyl-D-erythritol kinase [Paracoccus aestuarii]WCQ98889.1 4-(cytidine 5'-diphospho)-2-C-methyl-D-erythritol kinase [Paracoccus aestuarii]